MLIKYKDDRGELHSFFKQPETVPDDWTEYTEEQWQADLDYKANKQYLADTNYISCNYADMLTDEEKTAYLDEVSDTYGITNREIIAKRKTIRGVLNDV